MPHSPDFDLMAACNHTELFQICRSLGLNVAPSFPKEKLIALILGEEEAPPTEPSMNVVDSWRHGIMGFLLDHWAVVRSQLECPARTGDPRACFGCADTQVVSCLVQNAADEQFIQLKRKTNP